MNFSPTPARRLSWRVLGWYLLLALALAAIRLSIEYTAGKRAAANDLEAAGRLFAPAVSEALIASDRRRLDTLLDSMVRGGAATAAKVESAQGKTLAQAGQQPPSDAVGGALSTPDLVRSVGLGAAGGRLVLYADHSRALAHLEYSLVLTLLESLAEAAGLGLILHLVLTRALARLESGGARLAAEAEEEHAAESASPAGAAAVVAPAEDDGGDEGLRALFEASPFGLARVDWNGHLIEFNDAFLALSGYTAEELSGLDWRHLLPEIGSPEAGGGREALQLDLHGPLPTDLVQKNGCVAPVRLRGWRADVAGWECVWLMVEGRAEDATESVGERAAEAELRRLNADLSETLHALPDPLFDLDRAGTCCGIWARGLSPLIGDTESMLGHTVQELLPRDAAETVMAAIREADGKGASYGKTIRVRVGGNCRWFELSVSKKLVGDEAATRFTMVARDITERKHTELALLESEGRFRHLFENNASAMLLVDVDSGVIFDANQAAAAFYGYPADALIGMNIDAINVLSPEELAQERQRAMREERNHFDFRHRLASGEIRNVEVYTTPTDIGGRHLLLSMIHDVTERKRVESQLRLAANVFANSREGIVIADAANVIVDVNPGFTDITGYARDEAVGRGPSFLASGLHAPEFYAKMWKTLRDHDCWRGEIWNRRKDGGVYAEMLSISLVRDENGSVQHYIGIFSDISHIKEHEAELNRIAYYDALTGVPNRRLFLDRLSQAIACAQRTSKPLAVCYLDLDDFKPVNDRYGHQAGDRLLIEIAERARSLLRANDTVARLGGDEFVMLLTDLSGEDECRLVLDRVLAAICAPVLVEGDEVRVSASIGITLCPHDQPDADILLRHADAAMYLAKTAGKNRCHFFSHMQAPWLFS